MNRQATTITASITTSFAAAIALLLLTTGIAAAAPAHDAARAGDGATLYGLIASDPTMLEIRDEIGASPLYYAAWEGHLDIVERLIAMGAEVTVATTDGLTGLHWAALEGHLEVCRALLDNGADVNARTIVQGNTPLLEVWNGGGHPEVAQLLIERGADVDAVEKWNGMSILHYAANKGLPTLVRTLIDNGASESLKDNGGRTAAQHASNSATRAAFKPIITH